MRNVRNSPVFSRVIFFFEKSEMLSWFGSLMGVVSPSTEVVFSNSLGSYHNLWSAWDRPGSQTPRRSCKSALDLRFCVGYSSRKTVRTGTWCRSDRAGTVRMADET